MVWKLEIKGLKSGYMRLLIRMSEDVKSVSQLLLQKNIEHSDHILQEYILRKLCILMPVLAPVVLTPP
jgi:hypothetical protein